MTEIPVFLGPERNLFGIYTPTDTAAPFGVIILSAGLLPLTGPNRLHVELARRLAAMGVPCLRIDQTSRGDSAAQRPGLSAPETLRADFADAAAFFAAKQIDTLVLIGLCSGADDIVALMDTEPGVCGAVLLDPYAPRDFRFHVTHYRMRLLRPEVWRRFLGRVWSAVNPQRLFGPKGEEEEVDAEFRNWRSRAEMLSSYAGFLARNGKILCVFTSGVSDYYNHAEQLSNAIRGMGQANLDNMTEVFMPEAEHTYPIVKHRRKVIDTVCAWLQSELIPGLTR